MGQALESIRVIDTRHFDVGGVAASGHP